MQWISFKKIITTDFAKGIPYAKIRRCCIVTEAEKRQRRCAFTGHRPEKLDLPEANVRLLLQNAIEQAYADGYNVFISGMARGVDMWAADLVLQFREAYPDVKLMCAIPFPGHELRWSTSQQAEFRRIVQCSDLAITVCGGYSSGCYQRRNEWMIDHCSRLIAVWDGRPSGTKNAVDYAEAQGVEVINLLEN